MGTSQFPIKPCPLCKIAMQASKSDEGAPEHDTFTCNNCGAVVISAPTMWRGLAMVREVWREITEDGHKGSYSFAGGMITVTTPNGSKTMQIAGSPPEALARMLLRELVREGKG
jgi:hypothetical protein